MKYCFCSQESFLKLFQTYDELTYQCEGILWEIFYNTLINIGITCVIVILNLLMQEIIFFFVKKVRFISITKIVLKQIELTVLAEYINTSFVIILIYFNFFGFTITTFFNHILGTEFFKIVFNYSDFNREWYIIVVNKILLPFFLLIFNPHSWEFIQAFSESVWIKIKNKFSKKKRNFVKNNQLWEFDLAFRFKNIMKLLFVCFSFSSAIPILNIFIFLGYLLTFWFHKKIFITFSGRSPSYSSKIIKNIIQWAKVAYFIHLGFAMIFLSNRDVFPQKPHFSVDNYALNFYDEGFLTEIFLRLYKVLPLFLLLIVSIVLFIFTSILEKMYSCCCRRSKIDFKINQKYSEIFKTLKKRAIPNYDIISNPKYKTLIYFSKGDFQKIRTFMKSSSVADLIHWAS